MPIIRGGPDVEGAGRAAVVRIGQALVDAAHESITYPGDGSKAEVVKGLEVGSLQVVLHGLKNAIVTLVSGRRGRRPGFVEENLRRRVIRENEVLQVVRTAIEATRIAAMSGGQGAGTELLQHDCLPFRLANDGGLIRIMPGKGLAADGLD